MKKTTEQRLEDLERWVKLLMDHNLEDRCNRHLLGMGQVITNRLFELGPEKVDLELIAKLNAALGCDVMPVVGRTAKKTRKPKDSTKP